MKLSNIYILFFKDHGYIKIGKADDVYSRLSTLQSIWGGIDYDLSFYMETKHSDVFYLEKTLHYLCSDFKIKKPCKHCDGHSEMFDSGGYDTIIKSLKFIETIKGIILEHKKIDNEYKAIVIKKKKIKYIDTLTSEEVFDMCYRTYLRNINTCNNIVSIISSKDTKIKHIKNDKTYIITFDAEFPDVMSFNEYIKENFELISFDFKAYTKNKLETPVRMWDRVSYDNKAKRININISSWRKHIFDTEMNLLYQNIIKRAKTTNAPTPIPEAPQIAPVFTSRRFQ